MKQIAALIARRSGDADGTRTAEVAAGSASSWRAPGIPR